MRFKDGTMQTPDMSEAKNQVSTTKQTEPDEFSVEIIVFLLFKAFSSLRTYSQDHAIFQSALQNLFQAFQEFLDRYDDLRMELSESDILFKAKTVYHETAARGSVIFMLFHEGVRELRFQKGLTSEELKGFLQALHINTTLSPQDRDIISLLWSQDFTHIHYFAFDEIPDREIGYVENGLTQLDHQNPFDSSDVSSLMREAESSQRQNETATSPSSDIITEAVLSGLQEQNPERILDALDNEGEFNRQTELIQIIFDVIRLENDVERSAVVFGSLEDEIDELLIGGAFRLLNEIIPKLNSLVDKTGDSSPQIIQNAENTLRRLSEEKVVSLRVTLQNPAMFQSEDLLVFVTLLRPSAIEPVCQLLEDIPDGRTRAALSQGLEIIGRGHIDVFGKVLKNASEPLAKSIISILGNMESPSAFQILKGCVNHRYVSVKEEAIRALRRFDTEEAQRVLVQFLHDPDPVICTAAAESLEAGDGFVPVDLLVEIVQAKSFAKRSFREKKAILSSIGNNTSPESLSILAALLSKRSLISRKRYEDVRVCAAMALGRTNSEEACSVLGQFCQDSSQAVRNVCTQILRSSRSRTERRESVPKM